MEQLGRFKLGAELGTGPHTVTYEATDEGERCVVKVLNEDAAPNDPGKRQGLARALAGLTDIEHPSVVRVLRAGEEDGRLFVASEFMDCPSLEQKLEERERLPEQQAVLFVRQVAQALDKARDLGYSHGGLHAGNVFVVSEEKIKLTDFSVKALIEDPPDIAQLQGDVGVATGGGGGDEWVTAEDLLRSKGRRSITDRLAEDFVCAAVLMMRMLGGKVRRQAPDEPLQKYRDDLLRTSYAQVSDPSAGVSVHTSEVVRRLLTEDGFDSPGEVVVELASAMLLGRSFGRPKAEPAERAPASTSTAEVRSEPEPAPAPSSAPAPAPEPAPTPEEPELELEPAEATAEPEAGAGPVTAFYIWNDRRSGRFFIIREGQRISLGRDPDVCDVALMDGAVSRKHCTLIEEGGAVRVEDAGSSNGTFINDQRVEAGELRPGDRLRLGTTRIYTALPQQES
ncbi:MAG: FHA domain-containing protein [Planctomycetota bacterium]